MSYLVYQAFLLITSRLLRGVWARAVPLSCDYDNDNYLSGITHVRDPKSVLTVLLERTWTFIPKFAFCFLRHSDFIVNFLKTLLYVVATLSFYHLFIPSFPLFLLDYYLFISFVILCNIYYFYLILYCLVFSFLFFSALLFSTLLLSCLVLSYLVLSHLILSCLPLVCFNLE